MEKESSFSFEGQLNAYLNKLSQSDSLTEADKYEIEDHFKQQFDDLKKSGLDDEEAFIIASRRLGLPSEIADDYTLANNEHIQLKKTTTILAGVFFYFFLYYFVLFTSKSYFLILEYCEDNSSLNLQRVKTFLIAIHFVIMLLTAMVYFFDKKVIKAMGRLNIKPKYVIWSLVVTFIFAIIDRIYLPVIKNVIGKNYSARGTFYFTYDYFSYSFPLITCFCFMILYFRYFRKKME